MGQERVTSVSNEYLNNFEEGKLNYKKIVDTLLNLNDPNISQETKNKYEHKKNKYQEHLLLIQKVFIDDRYDCNRFRDQCQKDARLFVLGAKITLYGGNDENFLNTLLEADTSNMIKKIDQEYKVNMPQSGDVLTMAFLRFLLEDARENREEKEEFNRIIGRFNNVNWEFLALDPNNS